MRYLSKLFASIIVLGFLATWSSCDKANEDDPTDPGEIPLNSVSAVGTSSSFAPNATYNQMHSSSAIRVSAGNSTFFIGYQQVSATNQNCIIAKYTNGQQVWVRTDYENTGDDSRGYGLLWDGAQNLYALFSSTGTQGDPSHDFRRFCGNGWHTSYGQGGGPKVTVILKIDPITGDPFEGTYAMSRLANGNANSLSVDSLQLLNSGNLRLFAQAWYSPLHVDRVPYECTGLSPFQYTFTLNGNLTTAVETEVVGCK